MANIRLMIVDDHEVVRTGLQSLVEGTEIEVVATAASGSEAVKLAKQSKPDVVLLDIRMADGDGLTTLEELRQKLPELRVVMLSTYENPTYVARANAMGASDYILKGSTRAQLLGAIKAVAAGDAPSQYGEMKRVAGAMATREKEKDQEVALDSARNASIKAPGLGPEQ